MNGLAAPNQVHGNVRSRRDVSTEFSDTNSDVLSISDLERRHQQVHQFQPYRHIKIQKQTNIRSLKRYVKTYKHGDADIPPHLRHGAPFAVVALLPQFRADRLGDSLPILSVLSNSFCSHVRFLFTGNGTTANGSSAHKKKGSTPHSHHTVLSPLHSAVRRLSAVDAFATTRRKPVRLNLSASLKREHEQVAEDASSHPSPSTITVSRRPYSASTGSIADKFFAAETASPDAAHNGHAAQPGNGLMVRTIPGGVEGRKSRSESDSTASAVADALRRSRPDEKFRGMRM